MSDAYSGRELVGKLLVWVGLIWLVVAISVAFGPAAGAAAFGVVLLTIGVATQVNAEEERT